MELEELAESAQQTSEIAGDDILLQSRETGLYCAHAHHEECPLWVDAYEM